MAKDYILQDGGADTHQHRNLTVHFGAILVDGDRAALLISRFEHLLHLLELLLILLIHQHEGAHGEHLLTLDRLEL